MTAYDAVLALHVLGVLAAYGGPLAYPVLVPFVRRNHPAALPGLHAVQHRLNLVIGVPASTLIFLAGAFMVQDRDLWSHAWVQAGLALFAVISVVGAAVIVPATKRLAELAPVGGEEYDRLYRRYMAVEVFLAVLVVANVFLMATKPMR